MEKSFSKSLERKVAYGTATVSIKVHIYKFATKNWEGYELSDDEIHESVKYTLISDEGKKIEESPYLQLLEYNFINDKTFDHYDVSPEEKMVRLGNSYSVGEEKYDTIMQAVKEMKDEINKELGLKTEAEKVEDARLKKEKEDCDWAQRIIKEAETEGIDKLMTVEQIQKWRISYNNMMNEGGEGYIPERTSQEEYQRALEILGR